MSLLLCHLTRNLARITSGATCNILSTKCMSTLTRAPLHGPLRRSIPTYQIIATCNLTTEGDKDLSVLLAEEINHEKESMTERPVFDDFDVSVEDMIVRISRKDVKSKELVLVEFDVNESTNVDESEEVPDEADPIPESSTITSYPDFTVTIKKAEGTSLVCSCVFDQDPYHEHVEGEVTMEGEDEEEQFEQFDPFKIDSVRLSHKLDPSPPYDAETSNMDANLYKMLMTMMRERGVGGHEFAGKLLGLSNAVEHENYIRFLKDLKKFADAK